MPKFFHSNFRFIMEGGHPDTEAEETIIGDCLALGLC